MVYYPIAAAQHKATEIRMSIQKAVCCNGGDMLVTIMTLGIVCYLALVWRAAEYGR